MTIKEAIHHILTPPAYYYDQFFCPVKKAFLQSAYATVIAWTGYFFSFTLAEVQYYTAWIALSTSFLGLLNIGIALAKRIKDWKKPEDEEGREEYNKRR